MRLRLKLRISTTSGPSGIEAGRLHFQRQHHCKGGIPPLWVIEYGESRFSDRAAVERDAANAVVFLIS
jgi:hypothetical protein